MENNYLKRGKGKAIADIKKYDFFSHYRKNTKLVKLERTAYSSFLKDLLITYSETIVKENLQLKLGKLGYIRIQAKKLHFFTKDGERAKTLQVNWPETWKYWEKKYEGKTRDEITEITNKKVLYFENEHTNKEFYRHLWDNATAIVKFKRFYKFKPSRQYSRLIAKIVTDPNRTTFYYG
tara:strand:- start:364 stop:900 length:537 start_codon:yes stop_codon:yes gene_type:complete